MFISQQQNARFVWIALRPCVAFVCYFHMHEVHNSVNDQMNEVLTPRKKKNLRKQYGDDRQEANRPAVVDVVRATVA